MKKYLLFLTAILLVAFSFSVSSCGDDNDEPKAVPDNIVGYWRLDFSTGYLLMTLRKDGSYVLWEMDDSDAYTHYDMGSYSVKGQKMTLTEEDGDVCEYLILTLNTTLLRLKDLDSGEIDTWIREY